MGKSLRFLRFFAFLFVVIFTSNAFSAGYDCPEYKKYTSCTSGYYLSDCGTNSTNWKGQVVSSPAAGNTCTKCPTGYDCSGGAACPSKKKITCSPGYYLPANSTRCVYISFEASYCPGGTFYFDTEKDQGKEACPEGYYNTPGATSLYECWIQIEPGHYVKTPGGNEVLPCAPGTYNNDVDVRATDTNSICSVCPGDSYSDEGAASCTSCNTENGYHNSGTSESDHAGVNSCKTECDGGEYVAFPGQACTSLDRGYYSEAHAVAQGSQDSMWSLCPSGYQSGPAASSIDYCAALGMETGKQLEGDVPENCAEVLNWKMCMVTSCSYTKYYNGEIIRDPDCEPKDCTMSPQTVSAKSGYYVNGPSCESCSLMTDGEFPFSVEGNINGISGCYRNCTADDVDNSSSVTGTLTKAGVNSCVAQSCNAGYYLSDCDPLSDSWLGQTTASPSAGNSCKKCPEGYSCDGGNSCPIKGITCRPGSYLPKGETTCVSLTFPLPGENGSYAPGGTFYFDTEKDQGKEACPKGYYNTPEAKSLAQCWIQIEPGHYVTEDREVLPCAPGTYNNQVNLTAVDDSNCSVCPENSYSDEGAASCTSCNTENGYHNSGTSESDHANEASCKLQCNGAEYVSIPGGVCVSVGTGYYKEAHLVSQGTTSTRNQCPIAYQIGDPTDSEDKCIGSFPKTGTQENGEIPENCATVEAWNSCQPQSCSYKQYYDGSIVPGTDCEPTNCTKTPQSVTANSGYYVENASCKSCSAATSGEFPLSLAGNSDSVDNCYRNCTASDVENSVSVSGTVTSGGINSCIATSCAAGSYLSGTECKTCVANATCAGGTTTFECNTGYHISSDGLSCEPVDYTITLKKNGGTGTINGSTGTDDATQICKHGVLCNLPSSGLERFGYEFTGWGESESCISGVKQKIFTGEETLYACWSQQITQCQVGKYYDGSEHVTCPVGKFCPGEGYVDIKTPGCAMECPEGGTSDLGASAQTQCYITCSDKSITGGNLTADADRSNYNGNSYPACTYTASCDAGYVASGNGSAAATCSKCKDGEVCPGGTDESKPEACPAGYYCEEGIEKVCPDGGTSEVGSTDITQCYKPCSPTLDIQNGQGISEGSAYYDGQKYASCLYRAECDENYVPKNSPSTSPSCVWGNTGNCPVGFYCPPESPTPVACPDGGTSEIGSTEITQCYKIFDDYEGFSNGVARAKCLYQSNTTNYTGCSITNVSSCDGGYWYEQEGDFGCISVTSGFYSPVGRTDRVACPADPAGKPVGSDELASNYTDCYKTCDIDVLHSTEIVAESDTVYAVSADSYGACSFNVSCETGYSVINNDSESPSCDANEYTITLDKNGGSGTTPSSITCVFDSGICELPSVDDLVKLGYTAQDKWCTDADGTAPCYYAGQNTSTNISSTGTDITLYAVWTPNVYEVRLDSGTADSAATPATVYLKYDTGWFSNSAATAGISNLTNVPQKAGYVFNGFYSEKESGMQLISSDGKFLTSDEVLAFTTVDPTTIYAQWATGVVYCEPGTYYTGSGTTCEQCIENYYCPGGYFQTDTGSADPESLKACIGKWKLSEPGASKETDCYMVCENKSVENGIAIPENDKEYFATYCLYETGISDDGNPCDIVDNVCVETSCKVGYEMKDRRCVECNRENAISYKDGGICQIKECVSGFHPVGDRCELDVQSCTAPNAILAEREWDYKNNSFGPCTIKECDYGYHVASNACVSDVQPCNVENGTGFKEWDDRSKKWGDCVATSCAPGYTNDPSESNEPNQQCGECKNKYSVLGKLAVSSYVQGCEIASCMYQGELYNLEYNECVPICPLEEYSDETGSMVWDESRKECVHTCNEGYTMW